MRFRRGLYVMLVVIGMIAAASLLDARESRSRFNDVQRQNGMLQHALQELADNQARLMAMDRQAASDAQARSKAAALERSRLLQRQAQLEKFILVLLERSGNLRPGAYSVIVTPRPSASPTPTPGGSSPRPTSTPPAKPPQPTPTHSPTCVDIALVHLCLNKSDA